MTIVCALACVAGCDSRTQTKPTRQGAQAAGSATPTRHTSTALAPSPVIDLIANRYRWHIYQPGLVLPIASEGLRKYTQEYDQPWGGLVELDGTTGRVLIKRGATLRFPADEAGERVIAVRMHGLAPKQRVTLRLNGKSANLDPEAGWSTLTAKLPVQAGENELSISVAKRGSARGTSAYGLFHSIVIGAEGTERPAPLTPVAEVAIGGDTREALRGPRLAMYLQIPDTAHLVVDTGAPAATHLTISAQPIDGKRMTLLDADQPANAWTTRDISLAPLAGKLVRLELASRGPDAAWSNARIALEQAKVDSHPPKVENAILIVVDALRADKLAVYGKTRVRTPRITAAAKQGVVFHNNQAASPSSPPSHGSIQTGMIPRVHGVTGDKAQLIPGTPLVSTQMVDAGISAGYWGNNAFGMARLAKPGRWTEFHQPAQEGLGIDCTAMVPEILKFATSQHEAGKRFFISTLPYEPHVPYRYHAGTTEHYYDGPWDPKVGKSVSGEQLGAITSGRLELSDKQWEQLRALYDGEVEHFDGCFGTLMDGLAKHGLADNTAVIITGDHGEGMFEHGHMGHAWGHHGELANVPLIVIAPKLHGAGRTIETVTIHIDIVPTIHDLMGVRRSPRMQGESLLPLMQREGPWVPRVMSLEYGRSYSLRARQWRYIVDYSGTEGLYDLAHDPGEHADLVGKSPMALRFFRDVAGFFLAHRSQWHLEEWGTFDNHSPAFAKAMAAGG
jgi:arylsulfatase A-like enzyme